MRTKGITPQEFVVKLLKRSTCSVQVAACLSDKRGIFAWGRNHEGDGYGEHAEVNCLKRANPKRLAGSTCWVAARRKKSKGLVLARPCAACWPLVKQCCYVVYRDKTGVWKVEDLRP